MELTFVGTLYSMLTGLGFAVFYILNKKTSHAGHPLQVIFWIFVAHMPVFIIWTLVRPPHPISALYFVPGLSIAVLTTSGNLLTIRALSLSPFSLMVPVLGLSPVFASLLAIPLLDEWPSFLQWAGIGLSVIGVLVLYAPPEKPWDIFSFWAGFIRERGALSMSIAAFMWAASSPINKLALRQADPQFHALFVFTGLVITLFILVLTHGELEAPSIPRSYWPLLTFTGLIGALAYMMELLALQHAPAGPFEAIKRVISQVLAVVFGYFLFREEITRSKLTGIAILCLGVPLIVI